MEILDQREETHPWTVPLVGRTKQVVIPPKTLHPESQNFKSVRVLLGPYILKSRQWTFQGLFVLINHQDSDPPSKTKVRMGPVRILRTVSESGTHRTKELSNPGP